MGFDSKREQCQVQTFVNKFNRGEINFDNPIQRGTIWNKKQSSLYVHSLLYGILLYQKPFLISQKDNDVWDILDGKQRGITLIHYINNEFALIGLQNEPMITVKGQEININGKRFKQLPIELQEKITNFSLDIAVLSNATQDMESLYFNRSNRGASMSKIDLARSKNKSMEQIAVFREHPLFTVMFTSNALVKLPQDEIIVKSYMALNETSPDYSAKHYTDLMECLDLTEEDKEIITTRYSTIYKAYQYVLLEDKYVAGLSMKKTHFLSYLPFVSEFNNDEKKLAEWIVKFYSNMPDEYSETCRQATQRTENVMKRQRIISESIEEFLKRN